MSDEENNYLDESQNSNYYNSKKKKNISIDDIDGKQIKNVKITSPRTKAAMKKLGYKDSDLNYLTYEEFLKNNPNFFGEKKQLNKIRYVCFENLRKERINNIKNEREKLKYEDYNDSNKNKNYSNFETEIDTTKFKSTAIENQKKELQRLKNKNELELIGKVKYELEREIMKKKAEEKMKEDNEKAEIYQKNLLKKRKIEEEIKREKEIKKEKEEKELEENQRKLDHERYMKEIEKAKEEEKEEKKD